MDAVTLAQGIVAGVYLTMSRASLGDAIGIVFACPLLFVGVVRIMRNLQFALIGRESVTAIGRSRRQPPRLARSATDVVAYR